MTLTSKIITSIAVLGLWSGLLHANNDDLEFEIFPGAILIERTSLGAPYYVLPTSSMRKVNGVIAAEHNVFLSGELTAHTWEITPGMGPQRAHERVALELHNVGAEVLFHCSGRACGSSNQWANQVFHQSRLYGLDTQQSYTSMQRKTDVGVTYYALYSTEKGNHKVYLHLEQLSGMNSPLGQ